jgi:hypothetical protein
MPQILQQMKSVEKLNDLGYLEGEVVLVAEKLENIKR